jgi:hypothetical protein
MTLPVLRGRGLLKKIISPQGILGHPITINQWKFGPSLCFCIGNIRVSCFMASRWTLTPANPPSTCSKTHQFDNFKSDMPYDQTDQVWSGSIKIPRRSSIKYEGCKRQNRGKKWTFNKKWPTSCDSWLITLNVSSESFCELYKCTKFHVCTMKYVHTIVSTENC